MGGGGGKREGGRERESTRVLWLLLLYVFSSPWACPMQIGLSQECCLFYLRSSLRSSDLPLFYFCGLFPSLSFSHCHFEILFPILNYPTLLDNIVLVLPYIDMNPPWVYMCSPSRTPLPPLSPSHPSGSSQCTSPEHPVSCIEPGLGIHFTCDNVHVSMPFSHIIIPLSPSPSESKRLLF